MLFLTHLIYFVYLFWYFCIIVNGSTGQGRDNVRHTKALFFGEIKKLKRDLKKAKKEKANAENPHRIAESAQATRKRCSG